MLFLLLFFRNQLLKGIQISFLNSWYARTVCELHSDSKANIYAWDWASMLKLFSLKLLIINPTGYWKLDDRKN